MFALVGFPKERVAVDDAPFAGGLLAGDVEVQMRPAAGAHRAAAEALVESSPYLKAGLYEDHRLYEYQDEVG